MRCQNNERLRFVLLHMCNTLVDGFFFPFSFLCVNLKLILASLICSDIYGLFESLERGKSRGEESSGEKSKGEWFSSILFKCF